MSSDGTLESEELDNIQLVRMEDIQPRNSEAIIMVREDSSEVVETCLVDDGNLETCVMDDDDSNIGSMVSIMCEEAGREGQLIVPEILDAEDTQELSEDPIENLDEVEESEPNEEAETEEGGQMETVDMAPDTPLLPAQTPTPRWPTLEILPGGVINQIRDKPAQTEKKVENKMMYACAKCPQSFRHLFCLVKHVKSHEDEDKRLKHNLAKPIPIVKKPVFLKRKANESNTIMKKQRVKTGAPVAEAAKPAEKKYICVRAVKKRNKKVPKKS